MSHRLFKICTILVTQLQIFKGKEFQEASVIIHCIIINEPQLVALYATSCPYLAKCQWH